MDSIRIPTGLLPNGFRLSRERYTSVTVLGPGDVVTLRDTEAGGGARDHCFLRSVQTGLPAGHGDLTPPRGADSSYRSYRPPGGLALVRCRPAGWRTSPPGGRPTCTTGSSTRTGGTTPCGSANCSCGRRRCDRRGEACGRPRGQRGARGKNKNDVVTAIDHGDR
jgi:hypothetical protein